MPPPKKTLPTEETFAAAAYKIWERDGKLPNLGRENLPEHSVGWDSILKKLAEDNKTLPEIVRQFHPDYRRKRRPPTPLPDDKVIADAAYAIWKRDGKLPNLGREKLPQDSTGWNNILIKLAKNNKTLPEIVRQFYPDYRKKFRSLKLFPDDKTIADAAFAIYRRDGNLPRKGYKGLPSRSLSWGTIRLKLYEKGTSLHEVTEGFYPGYAEDNIQIDAKEIYEFAAGELENTERLPQESLVLDHLKDVYQRASLPGLLSLFNKGAIINLEDVNAKGAKTLSRFYTLTGLRDRQQQHVAARKTESLNQKSGPLARALIEFCRDYRQKHPRWPRLSDIQEHFGMDEITSQTLTLRQFCDWEDAGITDVPKRLTTLYNKIRLINPSPQEHQKSMRSKVNAVPPRFGQPK